MNCVLIVKVPCVKTLRRLFEPQAYKNICIPQVRGGQDSVPQDRLS